MKHLHRKQVGSNFLVAQNYYSKIPQDLEWKTLNINYDQRETSI